MLGLITGDHPRHKYLANKLINEGIVQYWVIETRESFIPDSSGINNAEIKKLFDLHFHKRDEAEDYWFKNKPNSESDVLKLIVGENEQNSKEVKDFIYKNKCHTILSYGCHLLDEEVIAASTFNSINIHGGISPWYRGIITHFWPSYNLEPDLTGMTLHNLTKKIDGGGIIHQTKADLVKGDGLHMLAGRVVTKFTEELLLIAKKIIEIEEPIIGVTQKSSGRLWTGKMWRPEHLLFIYKYFEDNVVDFCIDNGIQSNVDDEDLVYFKN